MIINQQPQLWFGKLKAFHVSNATYSVYNIFRKLDLRVTVKFPGSVHLEVYDNFGNNIMIEEKDEDEVWLECFVSSIVRSIITSDDDGDFSSIVEIRKINPFLESSSIENFLIGFKRLFKKGEKLGCNELVQVPSLLDNYLIDTFFKFVELTNCFDLALETLNDLYKTYPEVSVLIAKTLFMANKEIDAIKFIHEKLSASNINSTPGSSRLLLLQSQYCIRKNRLDLALPLAIKSVELSPSLFEPWENLVLIYISLNKFDDALLTLNACPMVTHKDKYILKRSTPKTPSNSDLHLPLSQDVFLNGITNLNSQDVANEHAKLNKDLLNLPASSLKSTFRNAYNLLSKIVLKLGWEKLLEVRSKIFVMEEEWGSNSNNSPIKRKRLCERWLDNLFMLLYEDMKIFTIFKAQELQFDSISDKPSSLKLVNKLGNWNKSDETEDEFLSSHNCIEWELIGLLSERLGYVKDAQRYYEFALSKRFSVKSAKRLIKIYLDYKKKSIKGLNTAHLNASSISVNNINTKPAKDPMKYDLILLKLIIGLLVWDYRWYNIFSPNLLNSLVEIINDFGIIKVENEIRGWYDNNNNGDTGVFDLVDYYVKCLVSWSRVDIDE